MFPTTGTGVAAPGVATEFGMWPVEGKSLTVANEITAKFDELLSLIGGHIPNQNARYLALVKTNLELASFYAIKGIVKPVGN